MTVRTLAVRYSQNAKTGPVALAVSRTQESCPTSCPLMGAGCYAENIGRRMFAQAARGEDHLDQLRAAFRKLRLGDVVRLGTAGDYLAADGTPDREYIAATNTIPSYAVVISYTHAWRQLDPAWFLDHVRPSASVESEADAIVALAAGWPVVMVDPDGVDRVAGRKAVRCPFETSGRQCVDCRLCGRTNRPSVVTFTPHGARSGAVRRAVTKYREGTADV